MATLRFELVAPERILFSGDVEAVMLPASEGYMTVMPGHAPVVTTLKTGFVVMNGVGAQGSRVLVRGGFAEINATGVTVLAERATPLENSRPSVSTEKSRTR
jgi:F-type H+-transporting ATPase subunit epsilon